MTHEDDEVFRPDVYLKVFPDVAHAISSGSIENAEHHYRIYGSSEKRLERKEYIIALAETSISERLKHFDQALLSESGYFIILGWSAEISDITSAFVQFSNDRIKAEFIRYTRNDVSVAIGGHTYQKYAFLLHGRFNKPIEKNSKINVVIRFSNGKHIVENIETILLEDTVFRENILSNFSYLQSDLGKIEEYFEILQSGYGDYIVKLNEEITSNNKALHYIRSFESSSILEASLITVLHGKIEFSCVQASLFTAGISERKFEFIYVLNGSQFEIEMIQEAERINLIYGVSITVVVCEQNLGFSGGCNIGSQYAKSNRLIFVNPDVFPLNITWFDDHHSIIENNPAQETRIFGVPMMYDDGSLMHGGMYITKDILRPISKSVDASIPQIAARVEHFGKGMPFIDCYKNSRVVPAVTGAFISIERDWFEKIGGFSEQYLFGHYEDADLCLNSKRLGCEVWIHNIPFWHLEGQGSHKRQIYEAATLINRWLFTKKWGYTITKI